MSLPAASSVDPPPPRSVLAAVLAADPQNRLHAAMVLVGIHRVPVPDVLDLTWPEVHAAARKLLVPGLTVHLDAATMDLLRWHSARQRLDRHRAGPAWQHSLLVFTDQIGRPYSETAAGEAVTIAAAKAGLPPLTLKRLRELADRSGSQKKT
jgi:hypothetical protein